MYILHTCVCSQLKQSFGIEQLLYSKYDVHLAYNLKSCISPFSHVMLCTHRFEPLQGEDGPLPQDPCGVRRDLYLI